MRKGDVPEEFTNLRSLYAMESVTARGLPIDCKGAERGNPVNCAFAHTLIRGGKDPAVARSLTLLIEKATPELIAYNGRRAKGIKPGDRVVVKYLNDYRLQEQIRVFDDQGRDFVPGEFTLLPPRRRSGGGKRKPRGGGSPPKPKDGPPRRPPQLTRIALIRKGGI